MSDLLPERGQAQLHVLLKQRWPGAVIHTTSYLWHKEMGKVKILQLQLHDNHQSSILPMIAAKPLFAFCVYKCQGKEILLLSYSEGVLSLKPKSLSRCPYPVILFIDEEQGWSCEDDHLELWETASILRWTLAMSETPLSTDQLGKCKIYFSHSQPRVRAEHSGRWP